jgi:hypothetical protein
MSAFQFRPKGNNLHPVDTQPETCAHPQVFLDDGIRCAFQNPRRRKRDIQSPNFLGLPTHECLNISNEIFNTIHKFKSMLKSSRLQSQKSPRLHLSQSPQIRRDRRTRAQQSSKIGAIHREYNRQSHIGMLTQASSTSAFGPEQLLLQPELSPES